MSAEETQDAIVEDGTKKAAPGNPSPKVAKVEHFTPDERAARGKAARAEVPRSSHAEWEPPPHRPDPVALLEEQADDARAGAGADPLRADAGLAVHVLPRRRVPDGRRPGGRAAHRAAHAALRRRAPVELRRLRRTGPAARLRAQRLRRDAPRAVRVGRQAPGRELRGRRPRPRLRRQDAARRSTPTVGRVVPRGDAASSRRCATSTSGTPASTSRRSSATSQSRATGEQRKRAEKNLAKARTKDSLKAFAKLTEIVDGEPRIISDPPLIVPIEELVGAGPARGRRTSAQGPDPPVPAHALRRPPAPARAVPLRRRRPQGRRRRQRRHPRLDRPAARPRRRRPAVPAGEGGAGLGARAVPRQERVRQPRPARRRGPAPDAGGERHHARLAAHDRASTASSATSTSASSGMRRAPPRSRRWSRAR